VLPVLKLISLCTQAAKGDAQARIYARELEEALIVLSTFDEGPDLVLYYKYLLYLQGDPDYQHHFIETDELSASQKGFAKTQFELFQSWWQSWPGRSFGDG